ncbi:MAG: hypothetical protein ACXADH_03215, partial [Candidatus Kariarchaeaceae archaeon]
MAFPVGYTSTIVETNNGPYLYEDGTGTEIFFNGANDDLGFDIEISTGTETNFWKVRFPAAFGESQEEDSTPSYRRIVDYNIDSTDSGATIDVLVIDYAGRTQTIAIDVTEDSTAPSIGTLNLVLTADLDSVGNSIDPDTGHYDDDSVDVTISGAPTDGESGLPTARYSYKYDGGSYGGTWLSTGTTLTSVPEGSRTLYVRVIDNVGNIAPDLDFTNVVVDLTSPTGFTSSLYEVTNIEYLHASSGTLIYFNGGQDNLEFDISISLGTEINFWKVRQPAAFGELQEELSIAPYRRTTDYDIDSTDSGTTIDVLVIDKAGRSQTVTVTVTEDSTAPSIGTLNLILTADTDSMGNGITPNTGYYDDDSVQLTFSGTPTDGGSGLPSVRYGYRSDDGVYGGWVSGGTTLTSVTEGSRTLYVQVRDNVGNNATDLDSVGVIVDLTSPTGFTSTIYETANDQYLYEDGSGTLIYFNGGQNNLEFDIGLTTGTETNFWKVRQPAAFGESQEEITSAPYRRTIDYDIDSTDSGTSFNVLVIDQAGRTQSISITVTEDSLAPTLGTLNLVLTTDTDSMANGIDPDIGYYDDNSVDIAISGTPTDGGSGLNALGYSYKYDGGVYGSWVAGGTTITSVPEGSRTMYVQIRDNVGNIAVDVDSVNVVIDLTNPTGYSSTLYEISNGQYLYIDSTTLIYFNGAEDNLEFDIAITAGTETNFWMVRFPAAFGETEEDDTSSPYRRVVDYEIDSVDTGSPIDILVIDRAGRSQQISVSVTEDSTAPSLNTITADIDTTDDDGDGYLPYDTFYGSTEAFYDQAAFTADISSTELGSGIASVQIKSHLGSYGSSVISGINVPCTLTADSNNTSWYRFEDNVGNFIELPSDINVYYGENQPSNFDVDVNGALAWTPGTPNYVYIADPTDITSGTIYINSGVLDTWTISVDADGIANWQDGDIGWFVSFQGGWGGSEVNDSSAPYQSATYSTQGTSQADLWIDIVNRCGIRRRITLLTTIDTTGPSMASITVQGNDSAPVSNWDQDGTGFSITPATITDSGSGNNGYFVEVTDASPDLYHTFEYTFPGFTYPGDVGSSASYTFYAQPVDKVGNTGPIQNEVGIVDESPPTSITTAFTNEGVSPNWFDQGAVSTGFFSISFNENNVYSITVSVSGGVSATSAGQDQGSPFVSSITINGESDGVYNITLTITDKAGHATTSFTGVDQIKLDNTEPSISINTNFIIETSEFLYWDSGNSKLWYGNDMTSAQSFTIGVDALDAFIGLMNATVSNQFGGTIVQRTDTSNISGSPTYDVPVVNLTDESDFTGNLIVTVYDLLGNANTTTFTVTRDIDGPTGYSLLLIPDTATDGGYKPNINYYDDPSVDFNVTGTITDGVGSGLPVNLLGFGLDEPVLIWESNLTKQYTLSETNHSVVLVARDNVGNNGTTYSRWVIVDTASPDKYDLDWKRASSGYFALINTTENTLYIRFDKDDYFNITIFNNGSSTIGNSDFWKIAWDINNLFAPSSNQTISGLNVSKGFSYYNGAEGYFVIRLLSNNGNYQEWNITTIEFPEDVTIVITSIVTSGPYVYYDGSSAYAYYGNKMGVSLIDFTISGYANSSVGMAYVNDTTSFGNDPLNNTLSGINDSWSFTYSIDENDGPGSGTFVVTFIAFNSGFKNGTTTFEFRYDDTNPETFTLNPGLIGDSPDSPFLYYDGSSTFGFYSNNMDGGGALFYVGGSVGDSESGLSTITDNTNFGENPVASIGIPIWTFA